MIIPFLAETMVFFVLHEHGNDHLDFFFPELLGTDSSDGVDDAKADSSYQHSWFLLQKALMFLQSLAKSIECFFKVFCKNLFKFESE